MERPPSEGGKAASLSSERIGLNDLDGIHGNIADYLKPFFPDEAGGFESIERAKGKRQA
jgi:hypothetical protein